MSVLTITSAIDPGVTLDDGHVVCSVLGRGGHGVVYETRDPKLDRLVATKVPTSEEAAKVLVEEGRMLASFQHLGLVTVHGLSSHQEVPVLHMERLYGWTLEDVAKRHAALGGLPWREAVRYLLRLVEAVQVLHHQRLVHCDIKPANVMVCPSGRVVLMDLGIAKQRDRTPSRPGIEGTVAYLAPEAIEGSVQEGAAHLVDIFALGATAFELLTGQIPDDGTTARIIINRISKAPPDIRDVGRAVPEPLARLVMQMISPDPAKRPASVETVLVALRRILRHESTQQSAKFSVLLVDDDPTYHEILKASVELLSRPVELRRSWDGLQALEIIRVDPPDLVLVDLDMPNMNGTELCLYLNGLPEEDRPQFAVMSSDSSDGAQEAVRQLGAMDFLDKAELGFESLIEKIDLLTVQIDAARTSVA